MDAMNWVTSKSNFSPVKYRYMPIINIPKPLRERLGEEATDSPVEVLKEFEKEMRNGVI